MQIHFRKPIAVEIFTLNPSIFYKFTYNMEQSLDLEKGH